MSQNSTVLPTTGTVSGLQMTQATNNALDTLNTLASGATAPSSPEAGQLWHDTTNNLLNIRNLVNGAWIPFLSLNEGAGQAFPYLTGQISGGVNRLINSGMDIDQVNEGSSYSLPVNNSVTYSIDQWWGECISSVGSPASGLTMQRVTDAPPGFTHSLKLTVGTGAGSVAVGDYLALVQPVEANNMSDFGYGGANAVATSLSFWVKSSVAGTYAVALGNVSPRQIVNTFTIAVAGVWQKVTIQNIPGDTGGTWGSGNATGILLTFTIAAGTNYQTSTLGAWVGGYLLTGTSPTNGVLTTSGATFQIAGAQWNAGAFSLPYEKKSIQEELALCERYLEKSYAAGTAVGSAPGAGSASVLYTGPTAFIDQTWGLRTRKRATPTLTIYDGAGNSGKISVFNGSSFANNGTINFARGNDATSQISCTTASITAINFDWTSNARM